MTEPEVPSLVTDRDFLYTPPEDEVSGDEEWVQCGKWIMHLTEFGTGMLDRAWVSLRPLLTDGTLIMLKASTALMELENAHIQCFTKPGRGRAKKAADAIRMKLRDFTGIMYYKQNEMTIQGRARRKGYKNHTKYMHTYLGRFYERDELNNWKLVDDDDDKSNIAASFPRRRYNAASTGSDDMPATSTKRFKVLQRDDSEELDNNWYTYCSCTEEKGRHPSPADRVWIVARQLYDRAVFDKISWSKRDRKVEIRFYPAEESDIHSQISVCDKIFREASLRGIMYYHRSGCERYSYKYTSENELYEYRQFGEIYLPNQQG